MQTQDAYGRSVEELGICDRCGATIKYIYQFDGKTYGSTCIEAVSNIHPDNWVWKNGQYDESATRKALAEKEAARLDYIARNKSLEEERDAIREINRIKYAELIDRLYVYMSDFCSDMARTIANNGTNTELIDILSQRQWYAVREVWAKQYGRSNSKAYNAGVEEFESKFCS